LKQFSFNLATRVLQDSSLDTFNPFLLSCHAIFPSAFRLQVGQVTPGYFPESWLLLVAIRHESSHGAQHFTRVEVFGSPNVHWVRGIIDVNDPQVFTFKREIVQKNLVNHGPQ